jgi:hypothetical protein
MNNCLKNSGPELHGSEQDWKKRLMMHSPVVLFDSISQVGTRAHPYVLIENLATLPSAPLSRDVMQREPIHWTYLHRGSIRMRKQWISSLTNVATPVLQKHSSAVASVSILGRTGPRYGITARGATHTPRSRSSSTSLFITKRIRATSAAVINALLSFDRIFVKHSI